MKSSFLFAVLIVLLINLKAYGQKRNNVWIFGDQSGLDFTTAPPLQLTPTEANASFDYITSICDTAGNLLFYSNGLEIWNNAHQKMVKQGVQWPWAGYAVPLICPYPGNDSLYYLFGVSDNLHLLRYLTINMKGDNGLGTIVYPPPPIPFNYATTLLNDASVMLTGIGHCNRKDQWIIAHSGSSLNSYLVTNAGVSPTPVITALDPSVVSAGTYQGKNFKFSANSEKMMMPLLAFNKVVVFDFNNLTGKFSNPITLFPPEGMELEEVEISPDGSKLYLGTTMVKPAGNPYQFVSHFIFQLDLKAGNINDILSSATELTPYPDQSGCTPRICFTVNRTMQVSPDGRIYVSFRTNEPYAHIIQEPNLAGADANYSLYAIKFDKVYVEFNMNLIRSAGFEPATNSINVKKKTCVDQPTSFSLIYKNADSVKWNFGDPASGSLNYSTSINTEHRYTGVGSYTVTAIIYKTCFTDTAKTTVTITADKVVKLPGWLRDTTLCLGADAILDVTTPFASAYVWSDGITRVPRYKIKEKGYYSVTASNECSRDTRRFMVDFATCDCSVFIPNAFTPNNDRLNDVFKPVTKCFLQNYDFAIYSRFGNVIFSTKDRFAGWDGRINQNPASSGIYPWRLQYVDPNNRKMVVKSGTLLLFR